MRRRTASKTCAAASPWRVAATRTRRPRSSSSTTDNASLDYPSPDGWGYAVFGKVTKGMEVVDKIAKVKTGNRGIHQNVPAEPVVIESVKVLSEK